MIDEMKVLRLVWLFSRAADGLISLNTGQLQVYISIDGQRSNGNLEWTSLQVRLFVWVELNFSNQVPICDS